MNVIARLTVTGLLVFSLGCTVVEPQETSYLRSAQDRATQDEVRQRLGNPALTKATEAGESVWVYEVREQQPGNRMTSPGLWCDEYRLTFDRQTVLRQWTHQSYFHGGEIMPPACIPSGSGHS